jgi:hypothetical protein
MRVANIAANGLFKQNTSGKGILVVIGKPS